MDRPLLSGQAAFGALSRDFAGCAALPPAYAFVSRPARFSGPYGAPGSGPERVHAHQLCEKAKQYYDCNNHLQCEWKADTCSFIRFFRCVDAQASELAPSATFRHKRAFSPAPGKALDLESIGPFMHTTAAAARFLNARNSGRQSAKGPGSGGQHTRTAGRRKIKQQASGARQRAGPAPLWRRSAIAAAAARASGAKAERAGRGERGREGEGEGRTCKHYRLLRSPRMPL